MAVHCSFGYKMEIVYCSHKNSRYMLMAIYNSTSGMKNSMNSIYTSNTILTAAPLSGRLEISSFAESVSRITFAVASPTPKPCE